MTSLIARVRLHVAEHGFWGALWKNLVVRPWWKLLTFQLVSAYDRGQARLQRSAGSGSRTDELDEVRAVVAEGQELRQAVLAAYSNKYESSGLRALVHVPPGGAGQVWMQDLSECMRHAGIPTCTLAWHDAYYKSVFESFRPNVFISFDNPAALRFLDLDFIEAYKQEFGLFRLLSAHDPSGSPGNIWLSASDQWRLDLLLKGKTADAFIGLMDPGYYDIFFQAWHPTGIEYLSLPMAANPLQHYPRLVPKDLDWAIATNNCDWGARAELTKRYMWDILRNYRGIIVGGNWGGPIRPMPHQDVPALMARARICPSPRIDLSLAFPTEIGGKTFEVAAMGGFILVSRTAALHKFFSADEVVAARDAREFNEQFRYFVERPHERHEYVTRALRRVYRDHTYFHRIDNLVAFLTARRGEAGRGKRESILKAAAISSASNHASSLQEGKERIDA